MNDPQDILILANGPGEIITWVRPVVNEIRQQLSGDRDKLRVSVILSPCPNATGKEAEIVRSYPEVDRVQGAEAFFKFLSWGKTENNWQWRKQGVVVFLGGDQAFAVLIAKRLSYKSLIYAEWDARWYRWVDAFGVMNDTAIAKLPQAYRRKARIVGDLMAEPARYSQTASADRELIGLLPGSKSFKLQLGLPLVCAIAEQLHRQRPQTRFFIPVAPTVNLETLAKHGDPHLNPAIALMGNVSVQLIQSDSESPFLKTTGGLKIDLVQQFPAYDILSQARICVTTVGANTAELGSLAIPAIVLIPTQKLEIMRAWDGLPGLLANLPGIGTLFAKIITSLVVYTAQRNHRLFAWPNIWAGEEIMPEFLGDVQADEIALVLNDYLENPEKLVEMRSRLLKVRGKPGAATKLVQILGELLATSAP
jgi:hypothetical protein